MVKKWHPQSSQHTEKSWPVPVQRCAGYAWEIHRMFMDFGRYHGLNTYGSTKNLVGGFNPTPLKNDGVKASWDDYSIPN
jgi:hypothetical protein